MTITILHNTLLKSISAAIKTDPDHGEMSKIIELFRFSQRNYTRFLDWLLWAEEWNFVVTNRYVVKRPSERQFTEGETVSPHFLAFPLDSKVLVEVEENEFTVTPDNKYAQWFAAPMVFQGHVIVRGRALNIVGRYSIPKGLRVYYAFGVLIVFLFNLMFWPGVIFYITKSNTLPDVFMFGLSSGALVILGMAVFLVLFKYFTIVKWRAVNRTGRKILQNYLSSIPES